MRNENDLKNFFDDDAYSELLDIYAEEDARKAEQHSILADVHRKTQDVPLHKPTPKPEKKPEKKPAAPKSKPTAPQATPIKSAAKRVPLEPIEPMPTFAEEQSGKFKVKIEGLDEEFKAEPTRRPNKNVSSVRSASAQGDGAFSAFSEVVRKHKSPTAAARAQAQPQAEIVKQGDGQNRLEALRIFLMKNKTAWMILAVCLVAAITVSSYTISCLNDIFAVHRDNEEIVTVTIPPESDTKDVLKILQKNDLIEHRHFCNVFAKVMKFKEDNYLTGVYYVTASMGVEKMLTTFKMATNTGETVTLTFPEGYNVDQIFEKLEKYEVCSADLLYQTMRDVDFSSEFSFISSMQKKDDRYRLLEGYLYPDTYEFYIGESPSSVLRKFLTNFQKHWTEDYEKQAKKMGMTVDEVVTLASIIQKEAYGADQCPLVSSVLHNRLKKSGLYPTLQCDSTEEYINDYIRPHVNSPMLLEQYTNRYSSYSCAGLMTGSICNPGDDAIKAALYPAKTDYYFFAHDVNKKLYLARNDKEHSANKMQISIVKNEKEKKKNH